ncbi:uncharacterized protein BP5553_00066 [Venustampulla echinocandica]|uniref:Uncharacterized protein n=1 Tax=Venustampulla echinocandica TaxID=2656787 RepID=A0A370TX41_9HELO|nr:uncharacterized protein BP5553_00066 [Venustampulla echinocandica]RDL40087.1 hypothetical protein BP5553_00066 [Venustampulla echinocandica]
MGKGHALVEDQPATPPRHPGALSSSRDQRQNKTTGKDKLKANVFFLALIGIGGWIHSSASVNVVKTLTPTPHYRPQNPKVSGRAKQTPRTNCEEPIPVCQGYQRIIITRRMAAVPHSLTDPSASRSSSASRQVPLSHGRGGAGNIGSNNADLDPVTLETPTIKSDVYTTGRGGSGNMAKNDDPEEARRAQDVVGHPRRESNSSAHVGRGGAANVFRPSPEEIAQATRENTRWESPVADDEHRKSKAAEKGLADKGKEWLFGKK